MASIFIVRAGGGFSKLRYRFWRLGKLFREVIGERECC